MAKPLLTKKIRSLKFNSFALQYLDDCSITVCSKLKLQLKQERTLDVVSLKITDNQ